MVLFERISAEKDTLLREVRDAHVLIESVAEELRKVDEGGGQVDGRTQVDWADTVPTTQSACTQLWLGAYLYRWSAGNQEWSSRLYREAYGQWVQNPFNGVFECHGPSLAFHSTFAPELIVGRAYRLQITARTQNATSAPTRKVTVQSFRREVIR